MKQRASGRAGKLHEPTSLRDGFKEPYATVLGRIVGRRATAYNGSLKLIITSSPLRISLGGGGTDLPSYYREHSGFLIAAAIDKYVYITLHEPFSEEIIVKYSKLEMVHVGRRDQAPDRPRGAEAGGHRRAPAPGDRQHGRHPGGHRAGLVGQLHHGAAAGAALPARRTRCPPRELAEQACHIEIDLLEEPIGKQDQYIAAYRRASPASRSIPTAQVDVEPLRLAPETLHNLEDNLMLFFTGFTRSASEILQGPGSRSKQKDAEMIDNLHFIKQLALREQGGAGGRRPALFRRADARPLGAQEAALAGHDQRADRRAGTNWRRANGALGGKLIGAGGGGFLMFYTEDKTRLRQAMTRRRACARCGSGSISRAARWSCSRRPPCCPLPFSPAGWPRACGPSPRRFPRR